MLATIQVSPTKKYYGNVAPWTGASDPQALGTAASTCSNWTAATGSTGSMGQNYLTDFHFMNSYATFDCGTGRPIYCFQQ